MRKRFPSILFALLWIGIIPAFALHAFSDNQAPDCPRVSVTCPDAVRPENTPIRFSASVTGGKPTRELSYCWTVSKGTIIKGQGTAVIEVEAKGKDREGLTATVDIGGLDPSCAHIVSCSSAIP